jgi:hypothetical protein
MNPFGRASRVIPNIYGGKEGLSIVLWIDIGLEIEISSFAPRNKSEDVGFLWRQSAWKLRFVVYLDT